MLIFMCVAKKTKETEKKQQNTDKCVCTMKWINVRFKSGQTGRISIGHINEKRR